MSKPLIAIVGRPNVGKSMLFNKIIGRRLSIVEDTPGVTRDRIYGESDWNGRKFTLVDTGGIEPNTDNEILAFMRQQAQIAIDNATVIVLVTDIKTGMTAADQEVAGMLQRSKKPIVLAVNKMDSTGPADPEFYEFYNLGLGDPIAVSAVHGHGTGDLLDACLQYFPPETDEEEDSDVIQVAIIGKPNVGKSSLTNRILGEQRVIVSDVAGTTRDAIDSYFENAAGKYNFIDTAGMRKKSKVDDAIEKYSVLRATMAIERSDVCLIMIDAQDGVTEQDTKVAGLAHEAGKACIIVVNKWDLVEKDGKTMDRMREDIRRDLSYMTYAPIVFISAMTGQRVSRLFELINYVREQASMRITTGMLNSVLADAQTRVQPPTDKGRRLKIYYMTQVGIRPPHFVVFCNDKKLFHFSYRRYLENQIRSVFGLEGTPIIMTVRQKGEGIAELSVVFTVALTLLVSYLLGCFNGSVMTSHFIIRDDVRQHGSGNAGLTNFYRTYGARYALCVIVCDMGKTVLACLIGGYLMHWVAGDWTLGLLIAGIGCELGHMFPVFFGLRGGKGILSGGVLVLMLDWRVALIAWGLFAVLWLTTRYVSLGSVAATASMPVSVFLLMGHNWLYTVLSAAVAALVIWCHRGNIRRLLTGTEKKFQWHVDPLNGGGK